MQQERCSEETMHRTLQPAEAGSVIDPTAPEAPQRRLWPNLHSLWQLQAMGRVLLQQDERVSRWAVQGLPVSRQSEAGEGAAAAGTAVCGLAATSDKATGRTESCLEKTSGVYLVSLGHSKKREPQNGSQRHLPALRGRNVLPTPRKTLPYQDSQRYRFS